MQLSVEYHKYKEKVQHMWPNHGFWNQQSIYNEHFSDLQGANIYCLEKNKENDFFPPIGMTWAYLIKQYFTKCITWHAIVKSLLNISLLPSIKTA